MAEPRATVSRAGLVNALDRAAANDQVSSVETILGTLTEHFPETGKKSTKYAVRALNRAVHSRSWHTVAYLGDYLSDTASKRPTKQVTGGGDVSHTIKFECVDNDFPPDVYGGAHDPSGFGLANPEYSAKRLVAGDEVVIGAGEITADIRYPPQIAGLHSIHTSGTREDLARAIAVKYQQLFDQSVDGDAVECDLGDIDLAMAKTLPGGTIRVYVIANESSSRL